MSDYSQLISTIKTLHDTRKSIEYVPAIEGFPFPTMYRGQLDTIEQVKGLHSFALTSHTGAGKTPVFLTVTKNKPTLVIEPRKFLQKQVQEYNGNFILFGRSEYKCKYARHAGIAPCLRKFDCMQVGHYKSCSDFVSVECRKRPCKVFFHDKTYHRHPCTDCEYIRAQGFARNALSHNDTVICNFGNFWQLLQYADTVVVDEADLFFRDISSARRLYHVHKIGEIGKMLDDEIAAVSEELANANATTTYRLQNIIYNLQFLRDNADLCFVYQKKDRIYIEINPDNVNILKDKIFTSKRVIIVTATPSDFKLPVVAYSIWQRCGIYYCPQGILTSRNLKRNPWVLDSAAQFIQSMSDIMRGLYGGQKFVIHAGNLGTHAEGIVAKLTDLHDGQNLCVLHTAGRLMETIDTFVESDKRYLVVASAEYGADFTWCNAQYVLKVPYSALDDRMKALERVMGKEKFHQWYTMDALNRLIQQCGRVGRGYDSFGCTFILDQKFMELYRKYNGLFPQWFKDRLHSGVF